MNESDSSSVQHTLTLQQALEIAVQHHNAGRLPEAEGIYQQILQTVPDQPDTLHLLGLVSHQMGKNDIAVELIAKALAIKPDFAEAHYGLGLSLHSLGNLDEAVASYQKALAINPDYIEAHNNLGSAFKDLHKLDDAIASFGKAIALKPDHANALFNLGNAHHYELRNLGEAVANYQKALTIKPDFVEAHNNLGNALQDLGKLDESMASYRKAMTIDPNYTDAHSNLIFIQDLISDVDQVTQQAERKRWNDKFILPLADRIKPHTNNRDPERRLRIGYVSADFRRHSACQGFASLILDHDRDQFDVICYVGNTTSDAITKSLRSAATLWRPTTGMSDEQLAQSIRDDAIDILVDLSGHTGSNRLTVFGHKPAPLQVTGVGHLPPGLTTIDYRLTTKLATPPEEENVYPEAPIYLKTFFGSMMLPDIPSVGPSPCVENGTITFGGLGRLNKVSDDVFALWAKVLLNVSGSRLLLKYSQLDNPSIRRRIKDVFSGFGIAEDRLILLGKTNQREHLEAYRRVDIALDSFPHGGGITTLESLWMGVPVIGLVCSNSVTQRVAKFICQPVGLEDWIVNDTDEYLNRAVKWAGRKDDLLKIRQDLRQRTSDCYSDFTPDVEKSYRLIWKRWCNGEEASSLHPLS